MYDTNGNYFRIQDTNLSGSRVYMDINGSVIPNNQVINGTQSGIPSSQYQQMIHFNNID